MGRLMSARFLSACMLLASLGVVAPNAHAGVMNGDFEAGAGNTFTFWDTFLPAYDPPVEAFDTDRYVQFDEPTVSPFGTQIEQLITIPENADTLVFDFLFQTTGGPSGFVEIPDSYQASLLLPPLFDQGVLPGGDPFFEPAFFSIDDGGVVVANPAVSTSNSGAGLRTGWTRLTLDISSLAPQDLLLEFALFAGTDPNVVSSASLDNVVLSAGEPNVVPEPTSFAIMGIMIALVLGAKVRRRLPLAPVAA